MPVFETVRVSDSENIEVEALIPLEAAPVVEMLAAEFTVREPCQLPGNEDAMIPFELSPLVDIFPEAVIAIELLPPGKGGKLLLNDALIPFELAPVVTILPVDVKFNVLLRKNG